MIINDLNLAPDGWTIIPTVQNEVTVAGLTPSNASKTVSNAGMLVNTTQAMRLAAVYACVRIIAQTIGGLPFRIFERTEKGRKLAAAHPLDKLLNLKPNSTTVASVFWGAVVSAMLLRGAAHVQIRRINNKIVSLKFLHPDRLTINTLSNGDKEYRYTDPGRQSEILNRDDLLIYPGFSIDGENGVCAISYGAAVFGSAMAANAAANANFENGLQPTTYIKNPSVVNAKQREDFRAAMDELVGAVNAGETVVLEGGQEIGTITIDPRMAQLLESRQFSVEQICTWFGVPPHLIGHTSGSTSWGSGLEQQNLGFLTYTLNGPMTTVAQVTTAFALTPAEQTRYYAEHVTQALLRSDSAARAAYYSTMVNNGLMTRAEVRELENLPNLGGKSELLTVQTALTPLDKLGETQNAP